MKRLMTWANTKLAALLKVKTYDPDLRRKGRVLAIMLLGMAASVVIVAVFNTLQGNLQYNVINALFLSLILGLFTLNRLGFVSIAGLLTVLLTALGSFLLIDENLRATYITMPIPILIASSLLVSWGGFVVAAIMICGALILGIGSLSLLILLIVAVISYLFANSLDRALSDSRHQALHDHLTGLPNRALFLDRLQQALDRAGRNRGIVTVLFMDLDNFKVINDSLGHELGDRLLIRVGRRLQECLRPGDTAARLGGDEFTLLLENLTGAADAVRAAERIAQELRAPFYLGGHKINVSTSMGIALSDAAHVRPTGLLRDADVAMYQAKKAKTGYRIFHSSMYTQALNRLRLEQDLRRDIESGNFEIFYQPKVLLGSGTITEMEALVRWGTLERGLVMPSEFIEIAEETGLIVPIGERVLEEACSQAREWRERYDLAPELKMCVNLSVRQFHDPNLADVVGSILRRTGLEASSLQLEITESTVMEDETHAVDTLLKLRGLGVHISIDDFGKGYSSLNYLKDLPVDSLKIDKSFVDGLGSDKADTTIVRLIVDLAHTLDMEVTAEGVETAEQLARLVELGCDLGQGYYFSKPLPRASAGTLLAANPSWSVR